MVKPAQIRGVGQQNRFINGLFYGLPGIGKTRLAGSSPKALILECGKSETDTCAAAGQQVDVWEIHNKSNLTEAFEYCRHEGYKDYEWVWIDGLSPLEGRLMREQLDLVHAANPTRRSDLVADKSDYQIVQSIIDRFAMWFVDLPMHVGFTAHVMLENTTSFDDDGDETETLMMMPQIQGSRGKLAQKICGYMNIVGYMDTIDGEEGKQRAMLVRGDGRHIAKDRFNVLGNKNGWLLIPDDKPFIPVLQSKVSAKLGKGPKKATGSTKKTAKKATKATNKSAPARKGTGLRTK